MTIIRHTYNHEYFQNLLHRGTAESHRNRQRLKVVLNYKRKGRLLEIGPGTGEFLDLAGRQFEVEGIEISPHALHYVKPELRPRIRVGNIEEMPLPDKRYEAVVAFNVLEHLSQPLPVLHKIRRALPTDGCLIGSVPCNSGVVGRFYTAAGNFFDKTHCSTYDPGQWQSVFKEAGFSSIHLFGELPLGPRACVYIRNRYWSHISPNMMFVCR